MKCNIRQETPEDQKEVFVINTLAFGHEDEAKLVDRLRTSPAFIPELSLVATMENERVGHILFTRIFILDHQLQEHESLALAPIAVKPELQKQGIGGMLIRKGLEEAKGLQFQSVIVLGHEEYYPKFGFEPTAKWNIRSPFDVPAVNYMALELFPDSLKGIGGLVQYAKEFEIG